MIVVPNIRKTKHRLCVSVVQLNPPTIVVETHIELGREMGASTSQFLRINMSIDRKAHDFLRTTPEDHLRRTVPFFVIAKVQVYVSATQSSVASPAYCRRWSASPTIDSWDP